MRPVVLCFSGLDPSGGAGLQADIEAIAATGAHAAVVCTALTHQDSQRVYGFECVNTALVIAQAEAVLADLPVQAFKLGMMGSADMVNAVFSIICQHPHIPVVMDPVLAANSGDTLAQDDLLIALRKQLRHTSVITPNTLELHRLADSTHEAAAIAQLNVWGTQAVWITGGHCVGESIKNRLFEFGTLMHESHIQRLPGEFHGSGCTLAAALAGYLALGHALLTATQRAESLVYRALQSADRPHEAGQLIPNRMAALKSQIPELRGLYAITDSTQGEQWLAQVESVLQAGVRWVQYRDKSSDHERRFEQASQLLALCQRYGAVLLINDDVELAISVGAHGVHLGQQDMALIVARARLGPNAIIGVTCHHHLDLALQAQAQGASYVAFGAVYASSSKPEASLCPLRTLSEAKARLRIPLVAIGGITPDNAAHVSQAGADAVAAISALWHAPSPFQQAQLFIREIYPHDH